MLKAGLLLLILVATACASKPDVRPEAAADVTETTADRLAAVIAGDHRTEAFAARDEARNPLETLLFFGIEPDMTVVEIWPGAGWYTEILAPFLRDEGTYIAAGFNPEAEVDYMRNLAARFQAKLEAEPASYGEAEVVVFDPPEHVDIAPDESVDMVLTFRNVHSMLGRGVLDESLAAFFRVLKPGGVLGVVAHRADAGTEFDPEERTGYVSEAEVIAAAEKAGFRLAERSEINANPRDTKDHPRGVWTLPPTLRLGDEDREKYLAIGESDRMTLRFVKP
jgi:predicted methyltransferase